MPNLDASSVAVVTPAAPTKAIVNTATVNALFGAAPVSANGNATITAKLLATRKSVADVIDTGAAGPSSGDTLEYTVVVDLSDFWSVALTGASAPQGRRHARRRPDFPRLRGRKHDARPRT